MSWTKKKENNGELQNQLDEYAAKEESWKNKEKSLEEALLLSKKKLEELEEKVSKVSFIGEDSKRDKQEGNNDNKSKNDMNSLTSQLNEKLRFELERREKSEKLVRNLTKRCRNLMERSEWNSSVNSASGKDDSDKSNTATIYIEDLYKKRLKETTILSNKLILLANKLEDMQLMKHSNKINDLIDEIEDVKKRQIYE